MAQKLKTKTLHTSRGTAATAKKGFKRATPELAELLRLANLVPRDSDFLPPSLPPDVSELPDAIRLELSDHMRRPETWHMPFNKMIQGIRERARRRDLPDPSRPDHSEKYLRLAFPLMEQGAHYRRIFQAEANIDLIVEVNEQRLPYVRLIGEIGVFRKPDGTVELTYDDLNKILQEIDIEYIRRCGYEKCRRYFYAYRFKQPGCCAEHSTILRKARKAERDKDNRGLKMKRATKARKR